MQRYEPNKLWGAPPDGGMIEIDTGDYYLVTEVDAEIAALQETLKKVNDHLNPCGHTGFESLSCKVCGYPDPVKYIAALQAELMAKLSALKDYSQGLVDRYEEKIKGLKALDKAMLAEMDVANERIKELEEERDGFMNGQQQMQDINCSLFKANNALGAKVKELESDALVMALRLYGEDDMTFGPECQEVMQRWGKKVEQAIGEPT